MNATIATSLLLLLSLTSGCMSKPVRPSAFFFKQSYAATKRHVLTKKIPTGKLLKPGPFSYEKTEDHPLSIFPGEVFQSDIYLPKTPELKPLLIFVHGNKFNKTVHSHQAEHLATWGFNSVVLDVPNKDRWLENGRSIAKLVKLIQSYPSFISDRIDRNAIILVGHSFGGSAMTIAASIATDIKGLILLDPAVVHESVKVSMAAVRKPVILLGADPKVFQSKKRWWFYQNIGGPISEITIAGATHNDAQMPSIIKTRLGFDWTTKKRLQRLFLYHLTVSAFSLGMNGNLDFAWQAFLRTLKKGVLKDGRIRAANF